MGVRYPVRICGFWPECVFSGIIGRNMHIIQQLWKAQLFKNLYGSMVGVAVAMLLYGAFQTSVSFVASIMSQPTPTHEGGILVNGASYQMFVNHVHTLRERAMLD